jgi:putative membrane protein insertion efficiency factor
LSESKIRLRGWAATALIAPIRFYRAFISPLFPPACRFQPSCSQYAIEAIATHGALKGLALAARRLARCHPISWLGGSSGFDPVPPR